MFAIRPADVPGRTTRVVLADATGTAHGGDDEIAEFCRTADDPGRPGAVSVLARPLRSPATVLVAGAGRLDESGCRAAGAAVARAAARDEELHVLLPATLAAEAVRGLAEGLWFGGYRYRDAPEGPRTAAVELVTTGHRRAVEEAEAVARAVWLARDLTNAPSSLKNPAWMAEQMVAEAATRPGVTVTVRGPEQLAAEGFGAILAVGGGSATPPRLVELTWNPPDGPAGGAALRHVVLVGKGITFDTGGISIKPRDGLKKMVKDMGGAAAVLAATLGAADLGLRVRITALAPLAENAVSGSAYRPGDIITHYDGSTSESTNSDAEGRLVLADALGYAVAELEPDVIIDMATLTGANAVALGKRTAALYSHDDDLVAELVAAGEAAGEQMWRLPLPDDYVDYLRSDIADRHSSPAQGAGSVVAALYLREFLGDRAGQWAHFDMSAPAWADTSAGELTAGGTGWGVRTLLRWLS